MFVVVVSEVDSAERVEDEVVPIKLSFPKNWA